MSVHADLFANEGDFTPRPAWQVIESARRQVLTGELSLATTPATRIYLRDGQVYFAERSTDGGLGVRLLVEGVITRQQMGKGALLVSGVEHLGRMFQRDSSIDRQSVELCVELMTDDVLMAVANDVIDHYTMTMYKRHPNGIDRWLPNRVELITHIVAGSYLAEPEAVITAGDGPHRRSPAVPPAVVIEQIAEHIADVSEPVLTETVPAQLAADEIIADEIVADEIVVDESELESEIFEPAEAFQPAGAFELAGVFQPLVVADEPAESYEPSSPRDLAAQEFAVLTVDTTAPAGPRYSMNSWEPITAEMLLTSPPPSPIEPPMSNDSGINLAQSAVDAIMSTVIADEVAEAVRRALAAIDAASQPSLELGTAPSNA